MTAEKGRLEAGIFLASLSVLLIELLLTRIFSVTMFHHLSFLAVSLAMMGLGAAGLLVTLLPDRFPEEAFGRQAASAAVALAVSAVLVVAVSFRVPVRLDGGASTVLNAGLVFALAVVPFLCGGLIIALILTHGARRANRLYGFDLLGAGLACLIFVPLTDLAGAPTAVLLAAAIGTASAIPLASGGPAVGRKLGGVLAALLVMAAVLNQSIGFFDVRMAKGRAQPPTLVTRWNSFSRVEVIGTPADMETERVPFSFGYSPLVADHRTRELFLQFDADALTQITAFDGDPSSVEHLALDVTAAAYQLERWEDVLVLGAGGGRDVLTALLHGSSSVTAVEVNPLPIELLQGPFAEFTGGLYDGYPGVTVVRDDGRNYVRRSDERFDLIQASLVDTWAASAAGAYALSENSLYTVDAFEDYLGLLTPEGVVAFSRWYGEPPVEVLRVVVLAREALRRQGVDRPAEHVVVVRTLTESTGWPSLATILVGRSPFTPERLAKLRAWAEPLGFAATYFPGQQPGEPLIAELLGPGSSVAAASLPYDLSVVDDNRPFFFDRVPLVAWLADRIGLRGEGPGVAELTLGGLTLFIALLASTAFAALLVLAPFGVLREGDMRGEAPWVIYFGGLGLGYIAVEIIALQRFNLYLGNPSYALSVVLFTMLTASGLGSFAAGAWLKKVPLGWLLLMVTAGVALYLGWLPWWIDTTMGNATSVRVAVAVAVTAPAAFLMGMPFPTGLRLAAGNSKRLVSWGWAVNGGASVLGSVVTVIIAMTWGFTTASFTGVAAYAAAWGATAGMSGRRAR